MLNNRYFYENIQFRCRAASTLRDLGFQQFEKKSRSFQKEVWDLSRTFERNPHFFKSSAGFQERHILFFVWNYIIFSIKIEWKKGFIYNMNF